MRCVADDRTIGGHAVHGCLGDGHDDRRERRCRGGGLLHDPAGGDRRDGLVAYDRQRPPGVPALVSGPRRVIESVPKSQYGRIHAGWRACIPSSRLGVAWSQEPRVRPRQRRLESCRRLPRVSLPARGGALVLFVVMLLAFDGWQYARRRRVIVGIMQRFGERFVSEFERPLRMPAARSARSSLNCVSSPVDSAWRSCSRPPAGDDIQTCPTIDAT